jgi:hypothetical protein
MTSDQAAPCQVIPPELVAAYARQAVTQAARTAPAHAYWWVEAHVPDCAQCRLVLAAGLDTARLDRGRAVVLTRLALSGPAARPAPGRAAGQHAYLWRLLAATPSLRRSWLAGLVLVLAAAISAARLAHHEGGLGGTGWAPAGMLVFLLLAPMLPLAGVAAAFVPRLDPAADLATAAPMSGIRLYCIRAVAVVAAALVPTVGAAFALPGGGWLPLLVVLPALAVSAAAVALATVVRPLTAAIGAAGGWVAVVVLAGLAAGSPRVAYGAAAQMAWLAVVVAAGVLLAARRQVFDLGWRR